MSQITSYGICALCGERVTEAGMARHLEQCVPEHEPTSGQKPARLYRLRIEGADSPMFWMDADIKADATLEALDGFLRQRWLECCGHLSSFYIGDTEYTVHVEMMDIGEPDARDMDIKLGEVLSKGTTFTHVYDFGTSTQLKLRVTDERQGRIGREPLRLLSSNEEPEWHCEECGAVAVWVCTECMWERENPFYCKAHGATHGCDEEMLLPVMNSPRMGMCAYGAV